jgi:hypothetical protein
MPSHIDNSLANRLNSIERRHLWLTALGTAFLAGIATAMLLSQSALTTIVYEAF